MYFCLWKGGKSSTVQPLQEILGTEDNEEEIKEELTKLTKGKQVIITTTAIINTATPLKTVESELRKVIPIFQSSFLSVIRRTLRGKSEKMGF